MGGTSGEKPDQVPAGPTATVTHPASNLDVLTQQAEQASAARERGSIEAAKAAQKVEALIESNHDGTQDTAGSFDSGGDTGTTDGQGSDSGTKTGTSEGKWYIPIVDGIKGFIESLSGIFKSLGPGFVKLLRRVWPDAADFVIGEAPTAELTSLSTAIAALPDGDDKTALQTRLDDMQKTDSAYSKKTPDEQKADRDALQADIDFATNVDTQSKAIAALPEGERAPFTTRLEKIKTNTDHTKAAEAFAWLASAIALQGKIDGVSDAKQKTALTGELATLLAKDALTTDDLTALEAKLGKPAGPDTPPTPEKTPEQITEKKGPGVADYILKNIFKISGTTIDPEDVTQLKEMPMTDFLDCTPEFQFGMSDAMYAGALQSILQDYTTQYQPPQRPYTEGRTVYAFLTAMGKEGILASLKKQDDNPLTNFQKTITDRKQRYPSAYYEWSDPLAARPAVADSTPQAPETLSLDQQRAAKLN